MPLQDAKKDTPAKPAADVIATVQESLKAAGFANATVRLSDGVHDAVITITIPKGR